MATYKRHRFSSSNDKSYLATSSRLASPSRPTMRASLASLALLSAYFSLAHLAVGVLSQPSAIGHHSETGDDFDVDANLELDVVDLPVYQPPYVRTATTASLQDWSSRTQRQRRLLHRSAASAEGAAAHPRSAERVACASNADCLKRGYPPLPQKPKTRHGELRARQSACSPVQ